MLPELKITQLRHFVWVATLKGFHAAAEKAHRTQPAISLSIRDLEAKLGKPLFEKRSNQANKTELTAFGQQVFLKAKDFIAYHDRMAQDMQLFAQNKAGNLRLASVPSIASQVLPDILQLFLNRHDNLHISFYDDNSLNILKMVEKQQVDFGIAHFFNEQDHPDKSFTPLWQDDIGLVCRKNHPLASHSSLNWSALTPYPLIKNGTSPLLDGTKAGRLLYSSKLFVSNMISLIAMLEADTGITTLPRYAFPKNNSILSFIPLTNPTITRHIGIVQLKKVSLSPAAQTFVDFIQTKCAHSEAVSHQVENTVY